MKIFLLTFLTFQISLVAGTAIVTQNLKFSFTQTPLANILVTLKDSPLPIIRSVDSHKIFDRSTRLNSLYTSLVKHSSITQAPILTFLSLFGNQTEVKSFWISNQIFVKNANVVLVESLEKKFGNLISSIDKEWFGHIPPPVAIQSNITDEKRNLQWGIQTVKAREAWEELGGVTNAGKGVIIGAIDTGARGTHEILQDNFLGKYGWYDAVSGSAIPIDKHGHGTHVLGSVVGKKGYGVAPSAKWSACRACDENAICTQAALTACTEFMLCPHLPDGTKPDCSKAPHIVSNSWIINKAANVKSAVAAWRAAGIIPVFAIGNEGPECETVASPGDYDNVIGVGATTINDEISDFSSLGPTCGGRLKPDISAPGSEIVSAYHTADTHYLFYSGTSMATPHVAGAIALLLTKNKNLSFDQVRNLLINNADQQLTYKGSVCGGISDNHFPNHVFGHGRLNAFRSVYAQSRGSKLDEDGK